MPSEPLRLLFFQFPNRAMKNNAAAIVLVVLMFLSGSTVLSATVMKFVNADNAGMVKVTTVQ